MSLFGGPDYSGIIWRPQQFPEGGGGIGGFMDGLGTGKQAGMDYKQAKKDYDKQSWADPTGERPDKPSRFQFFTGTAPQQQSQGAVSPQSPGGMFLPNQVGGGVSSDLHGIIDSIADKLKALLDRMGGR